MTSGQRDPNCIFCKIIAGQVPCQKVFENEHVLAFLDINPLADGHTVVVPRHHADSLGTLPPDWAAELGRTLGRIATTVVGAVGATGYNVLQNNGRIAGQIVPHVHFHIVPRREGDGLGYRWQTKSASAEDLTRVADQIRARG